MPERPAYAEILILGSIITATIASYLDISLIGARSTKKKENIDTP